MASPSFDILKVRLIVTDYTGGTPWTVLGGDSTCPRPSGPLEREKRKRGFDLLMILRYQ